MEISLPAAAADMGVRLWLFHLEHESSRLPDYVAALHAKEVAVLKRIRCVHAATRYAACRWHLRKFLLSRYGRQTEDWRIGTHIFGKPFLEVPHGQSAPFLNFSHSGFCGCIALTEQCQVGVDVEQHVAHTWLPSLQKHWHAQERCYVNSSGLAGFYDLWTRKEAILKARGCGFSHSSLSGPLVVGSHAEGAVD